MDMSAVNRGTAVGIILCGIIGIFLVFPGHCTRQNTRQAGWVLLVYAIFSTFFNSSLTTSNSAHTIFSGSGAADTGSAATHVAGATFTWQSVEHVWKRTEEVNHLGAIAGANEAYEHHGDHGTLWKYYGHPKTIYGERNTLMVEMLGRVMPRRVFEFAGNGGFLAQAALLETTCRRSLEHWVHSEFSIAALDYAAALFSMPTLMSSAAGRLIDADAVRRAKGVGWHAKIPYTVVHNDGAGPNVTLTILNADLTRLDAVRRSIKLHAFDTFVTISFEHFSNDLRLIHMMPVGATFVFSAAQFNNPDHARFFPNEADLRARYATWLDFLEVKCVRCVKGRGKWVVRSRVRSRPIECRDRSRSPPLCDDCIEGLVPRRDGSCGLTESAVYVRTGLEQLAKMLLGSKAALGPPLLCSEPSFLPLGWDYLDSKELTSRQALIAHWMMRSQPQRILDIGSFTSPIYKHMLHCPSEVVIVEPCAELAMPGYHHGVRQQAPWYSRMRLCPNPDDGEYLLTVVSTTIQEYLTLRPHFPFDAVVCVGCDGGKVNQSTKLGRNQSKELRWRAGISRGDLTRRFVRPFELFVGFPPTYDAARMQFSMLLKDDPTAAQGMLDDNCSLRSHARLTFPTIANTHGAQRLIQHAQCSVDPVPLDQNFLPSCSASGFLLRSVAEPDLCVSSAHASGDRHDANLHFVKCDGAASTFKLAPSRVAFSFYLISASKDLCVIGKEFADRRTTFSGDSRLNMALRFRYSCKLACCRGSLPHFQVVNAGRGKFYLRASGVEQQYAYFMQPRKNGKGIAEGQLVDLFRSGPREQEELGRDFVQLQYQMIDPATQEPCKT